jgi:menaquinone-dependent protoporphyrinogen oxidase
MAKSILVAYATNAGSSAEVAQTVADELAKNGAAVDVRSLPEVTGIDGYDAVVVGAPMIMGWHRAAQKFIRQHRQELSRVPVAYFFMAVSLTHQGETQVNGVPVWVDTRRAVSPKEPGRFGFRERYSLVSNYLGPVLRAAPEVNPVSAAFFGGKLDLGRLKLLQMLFVLLIIQAQPGDYRNWDYIRQWADHLHSALGLKETQSLVPPKE